MALNTLKCNHLTPLGLKALKNDDVTDNDCDDINNVFDVVILIRISVIIVRMYVLKYRPTGT